MQGRGGGKGRKKEVKGEGSRKGRRRIGRTEKGGGGKGYKEKRRIKKKRGMENEEREGR